MTTTTESQAPTLLERFKWLLDNHEASNATTASLLLSARAAFINASKAQHDDDHFQYLDVSARTLRNVIKQRRDGITRLNPVAEKELTRIAIALSESLRKRDRLEPPWKPKTKKYRVQRGDTVYRLAKRSNMSKTDFEALNDLAPHATLNVGQQILVGGDFVETGLHNASHRNPVLPLDVKKAA